MKNLKSVKYAVTLLSLGFFLLTAFTGCSKRPATPPPSEQEIKEYEAWKAKRIERLKQPTGWLSLAGLFWLEEGLNTFGLDDSNDFIPNSLTAPAFIGTFNLKDGQVTFRSHPKQTVTLENAPVTEQLMKSDGEGKPTYLAANSLSWYIIKRGDKLGVRVRDSKNPRIQQLKSIPAFPFKKEWQVKASFTPHPSPKTIMVPSVLGTINKEESPGILTFSIGNKEYTLHPMGSDEYLFLVFGDTTNGKETYGAGRFLGARREKDSNTVILDFNRATNPPCAFSPYATCPMPPEENILPIAITAGEKLVTDIPHH